MSVMKLFISLFIIFLISCNDNNKMKKCLCIDEIDSIKEIPRYKFIDLITQSDSMDLDELKKLEFENTYIEDLKLNIINTISNERLQSDFVKKYIGQYYAQNQKSQQLKRFVLTKDSIRMFIDNKTEFFIYKLYDSYNQNNETYFKINAGRYFLNFTPSGIVFVRDNLCMDCPAAVFSKK